jgi:hypothetical protein
MEKHWKFKVPSSRFKVFGAPRGVGHWLVRRSFSRFDKPLDMLWALSLSKWLKAPSRSGGEGGSSVALGGDASRAKNVTTRLRLSAFSGLELAIDSGRHGSWVIRIW